MKIISIGDIHGRTDWQVIDPEQYDHIVFVGDYCDSSTFSDEEEIANLTNIIEFKKRHPEKVRLLLGNHDLHYIYYPYFRCGRYRPTTQPTLTPLFQENENLFEIAFQVGRTLWTHAGISNAWLAHLEDAPQDVTMMAAHLQSLHVDESKRMVLHMVGPIRRGSAPCGGITWADKFETKTDFPDGLHQIVGHSRVNRITSIMNAGGTGSITYIDCLHSSREFCEIEL